VGFEVAFFGQGQGTEVLVSAVDAQVIAAVGVGLVAGQGEAFLDGARLVEICSTRPGLEADRRFKRPFLHR